MTPKCCPGIKILELAVVLSIMTILIQVVISSKHEITTSPSPKSTPKPAVSLGVAVNKNPSHEITIRPSGTPKPEAKSTRKPKKKKEFKTTSKTHSPSASHKPRPDSGDELKTLTPAPYVMPNYPQSSELNHTSQMVDYTAPSYAGPLSEYTRKPSYDPTWTNYTVPNYTVPNYTIPSYTQPDYSSPKVQSSNQNSPPVEPITIQQPTFQPDNICSLKIQLYERKLVALKTMWRAALRLQISKPKQKKNKKKKEKEMASEGES